MSDALALSEATAGRPSSVTSQSGVSLTGSPATRSAGRFAPRWPLWALALVVGCGGAHETTLPPAENPPATAKERVQTNPRMKADFEANSKAARSPASKK